MPKIIPPSPEAAATFKFTEVPASLYTGVPNITIPIYEIESGGVTVPISISYHARGIKMGEIASRVGLGWTLNCGGMVSRQIRSYADDISTRVDFNNVLSNQSRRLAELTRVSTNDFPPHMEIDYMPDQYYYNVNGLSGKFIYDYKDGKPLVQRYSDLKVISPNLITDGQGTIYKFGEIATKDDYDINGETKEISEQGSSYTVTSVPQDEYQNTWHLRHIITKDGSAISFAYENETSSFVRRSFDKFDVGSNPQQYKSHASKVISVQKRLKEIFFDKGRVEFEYHSETREDISGGNYLKRITVYNNSNPRQIIKQVEFGYEYVEAPIDNNTHPVYRAWDLPAWKRLYLKTVQFKYGTQMALPPYRFEYNAIPLPNRHNNSQDVWGYYNGKSNGNMLKSGHETPIGARSVDTVYSAAGMLEKIIQPEGGYTRFYYEHNRVFNPFPPDVVFDNPNPYTAQYVYITSSLDYQNPNVYSATTKKYRKTFTIPESMAGVAKYMVDIAQHTGCQYPNNLSTCKFNIKIYNSTTGYLLLQTGPGQTRNIPALKPGTYTLEVEPLYKDHNPSNDQYIIFGDTYPQDLTDYWDPNNPNNVLDTFSVYVSWMQTLPSTDPIYGAGKRIKKIEYRDPLNNQGITKTYDYNDPATGKTSGQLLGLPNFLSIEEQRISIFGGDEFNSYGWVGNVPGSIMSTYQEQSVGYGTVTEYIGEGNNILGKTVHKFTMFPDEGKYYEFPYHPPTDNEWLRGKELAVDYYKKNTSSGYTLVRKVLNHYKYGGQLIPLPAINYRFQTSLGLEDCPNYEIPFCETADYLKNRKYFRIPFLRYYSPNYTFEDVPIGEGMYKAYHFTGGTMDISNTTTIDYFDDGSQVQTTNEYFYDHDNHYNVAEYHQTTSNSQEKIITKYYYPADPEMAGKPAVPDLLTMNVKEIPLVTQTYKGGTKISETETRFKNWNTATNLLAPEYIKTAKGTNPLENRIQYTKLDAANGNILEVRQVDGNYVSYIWGHDGTYPIAKIENATFQQVLTALGTTEATLKLLTTAPSNIRTALPNALITTYEYKLLVGVKSITDPNGVTTFYEYDEFNRLKAVRDKNNNILSETQYNYRP